MSTKKLKKRNQENTAAELQEEEDDVEKDVITKTDYKIVDYLKAKTPTKRTKFLHHQVDYFHANKAVDVLLDSQWATGDELLFTDRQSVVDYLNRLLTLKFFHRAKKIAITDKDLKPKELKKKREKEEREKARRKRRIENGEESEEPKREVESEKEDKKKKKKIKLDMHLDQVFIDGTDAYVWMYEPIPFWYYIAGGMCLVGAVAVCLFPLWPSSVRKGVYYLSMAAFAFIGIILGLAVFRTILFLFIWILSMGRHHFWFLPNLTADVGFFESFVPIYQYEYRGTDYVKKKKKKKKVVVKTEEDKSDGDKQPLLDEAPNTEAEDLPNTEGEEGANTEGEEGPNTEGEEGPTTEGEDLPNTEGEEGSFSEGEEYGKEERGSGDSDGSQNTFELISKDDVHS